MGPGGFPGLQNQCDLTPSGWVGSIPTRSRQPAPCLDSCTVPTPSRMVGCSAPLRSVQAVLLLCGLLGPLAAPAPAQQRDTARVDTVRATPRDTAPAARARSAGDRVNGPPVSPRRAFLQSLFVPGWGQTSLDRGTAGAIFVAVEMGAAAMAIKSKHDLDLAKRFRTDSVIVRFDDGPDGPRPVYEQQPPGILVRARRQHFEDYVALLVFNHLIAGADAFVAAHLWDLPLRLSVQPRAGAVDVSARVVW